jgi:protein-L-isoaspartate(D-aspartate) O-methyltransferase
MAAGRPIVVARHQGGRRSRDRDPDAARRLMVDRQLSGRGIHDARILQAFREVPREAFVPSELGDRAYQDSPLPIGEGQTISQPYVVALMVEALAVRPTDRVLEVGAGSGYAAAILSRLAGEVYTIERHPGLAAQAAERVGELGYANVHVREGDGTLGWPDRAPFDAILVSAGGREVPAPLVDQLAEGGRLVIPVGDAWRQELIRIVKTPDRRLVSERLGPVVFVPLVGGAGDR